MKQSVIILVNNSINIINNSEVIMSAEYQALWTSTPTTCHSKKSQSSSIRQHFYREWQDREIGTEFKKEKNVVYQLFPGLKHIIPVKTKEQLIRVVFTSYLTYQYQTSALTNERQITKRELK